MMPCGHVAVDIVGKRFGRLIVLSKHGVDKTGKAVWLCRCDCGNVSRPTGDALRRRVTQSCGCLKAFVGRALNLRHGLADTPIHAVWMGMRRRCNDPNDQAFKNYGGRGIKVCDRWNVFENFLADMGMPPPNHEIERLDNNGNYELGNCCWATRREQSRNKRNILRIEFYGRTQCLKDWSEELGIKYGTLYRRVVIKGESPETDLSRSVDPKGGQFHAMELRAT